MKTLVGAARAARSAAAVSAPVSSGVAVSAAVSSVATVSANTAVSVRAASTRATAHALSTSNTAGSSNNTARIAFYDAKSYQVDAFKHEIDAIQKHHNVSIDFKTIDVRLTLDTVPLCKGCNIVCIFVNDVVDGNVAQALSDYKVGMVAIRAAGFNNVDLNALDKYSITVARVPAYSPYAVAEFATALLLALNRKTHHAYNRVRDFNFSLNRLVGFDLHGKTVGVFGTGKIGICFINIMLGFGCKVICYDVYQAPSLKSNPNVRYATKDEVFANSDIISLHLPLLKDTNHLINKESIKKMKPSVILINTGRGELINTHDLLEAVRTERIAGCGLDVYEDEASYFFEDRSEYVMKDEQLLSLIGQPNVILTSHQAFLTKEALHGIAHVTLKNILEFVNGKKLHELQNSLNKKTKTNEGGKISSNATSGHEADRTIKKAVEKGNELLKNATNIRSTL